MKKNFILMLLLSCQSILFAQDKIVMKIAEHIKDKKDKKAKELLDNLDGKSEYQSDISYWFVRTAYYRNIAIENPNKDIELAEAQKSFKKLVELDRDDEKKLYSEYIPSFRKDLFKGKNGIESESTSNSQSGLVNQVNDGKTVTLTEIGQGKTKDAAKYNALRNALEKAYGAFISSNTTIFKDELVKDEIVSISSGNIQNFEILSETQMPDGSFSSVVKATVSIGKLTSFCESNGITVEFKGGLFATNIKLQELNKKNEEAVMKNLFYHTINKIIGKSFDYSIEVSDPKYFRNDYWIVSLNVTIKFNNNWDNIIKIIENTFDGLNMSPSEISNYKNKNIKVNSLEFNSKIYNFRSSNVSFDLIRFFDLLIPLKISNFNISNGISNSKFQEIYNCLNWEEYDIGTEYGFDSEIFLIKNCKYFSPSGKLSMKNLNHKYFTYPNTFFDIKGFSQSQIQEYLNQSLSNSNFISLKLPTNLKRVIKINNLLHINDLSKVSEYKAEPIK